MLTAYYAIATLTVAKTHIYPILTYCSLGKAWVMERHEYLGRPSLEGHGGAAARCAYDWRREVTISWSGTLRIAGATNTVNHNEKIPCHINATGMPVNFGRGWTSPFFYFLPVLLT